MNSIIRKQFLIALEHCVVDQQNLPRPRKLSPYIVQTTDMQGGAWEQDCVCSVCLRIPYSGLFSWVEIFMKSRKRPSELNFVVLNFVARNVNFELSTRLQSTKSVGAHIPEREVLAPLFGCASALFTSLFTSSMHHHTRDSLRKGTLWIKATVNRTQVAKKSYKNRRPVRTLARVHTAAVWVG